MKYRWQPNRRKNRRLPKLNWMCGIRSMMKLKGLKEKEWKNSNNNIHVRKY